MINIDRNQTGEDCNKYIVQTECKEQDPNNVFNGRCVGLFNPPIQDKFNFSLPDKRYGVSFLIKTTDAAYNATNDNGMQVKIYDQCKFNINLIICTYINRLFLCSICSFPIIRLRQKNNQSS